MIDLQIKHYMLPHDGVIPGARGHKKQVIPKGTKVYCIVYGTLIYWCAYLEEDAAIKTLQGLRSCTAPTARRFIAHKTLVEWNFKRDIPVRVARPKAMEWLS